MLISVCNFLHPSTNIQLAHACCQASLVKAQLKDRRSARVPLAALQPILLTRQIRGNVLCCVLWLSVWFSVSDGPNDVKPTPVQAAAGREQKQSECSEAQSMCHGDHGDETHDIMKAFCLVVSWSVTVAMYSRILLEVLEQHGGYLCKVCAYNKTIGICG